MQAVKIPDEQISTTDPGELIEQYSGWVRKIARRYSSILERSGAVDNDDLIQVGSLALLTAQEKYDPAGGAGFLSFSYYYISGAIRRELGFNSQGKLPPRLESLDKPIDEEGELTIGGTVPDPDILPFEELIIEQEQSQETAEAVRAAVGRLKNAKQREVIKRVYLDGQDRTEAAAGMGLKYKALCAIDKEARHKLRADQKLREYAVPLFHVSVGRFNSTWTSATEAAVLWRLGELYQSEGVEA